jgi:hypothetical protein
MTYSIKPNKSLETEFKKIQHFEVSTLMHSDGVLHWGYLFIKSQSQWDLSATKEFRKMEKALMPFMKFYLLFLRATKLKLG